VVVASALGLTGCSSILKAAKAAHNVEKAAHNLTDGSAAISSLTDKIKSADATAYEVTYVTTGSSPATVNYAAEPPNDFAFDDNTTSGKLEVLAGSAGQFECNQSASGATWSCLKAELSGLNTSRLMYAIYSGAYWLDFLKIYSVAAALHGVSISSSTKTVNGFNLQCAVVVSGKKPNQGTSQVCVTSQGILGYVSVSSTGTDFEIKSYSPSPSPSLFQIPKGATVTTIPTSTTS
jgi:hypothetical protein